MEELSKRTLSAVLALEHNLLYSSITPHYHKFFPVLGWGEYEDEGVLCLETI